MRRQEAEETKTLLVKTGTFTRVNSEAQYPFMNFTVYARIENTRTGNTVMRSFDTPLTEQDTAAAAKEAKKEASAKDKRTRSNFRLDRENQY